jgi:oligosaccharide repeat unit polymerase
MIAAASVVYGWALASGRPVSNQVSSAYIYQLPYLFIPGCMLLTAVAREYRVKTLSVVAYLVIGSIALTLLPTGERLMLMQTVVAFVVLWMLRRRFRPSGIGVVIGIVSAFYVIVSMRDLQRGFGFSRFLDSLTSYVSNTSEAIRQLTTNDDTEMFDALALEIGVIPETVAFQPGSAIYLLVTHVVPRSMWADKPRAVEGILNYEILGTPLGGGGIAFSMLGGFYYDSGVIGVIIGMGLLGVGFRILWEYYRTNLHNDTVIMVYAASVPFVISLLRGNLQYLLAVALFVVVPIILVARFFGKHKTTRRQPTKI